MQQQFLEVVDREEAERRFRSAFEPKPLGAEEVSLASSHGRVLAGDVVASVNVPGFDRSDVDGYALRAADTFSASETRPVTLQLNRETLPTGVEPQVEVAPGWATSIATGAILPRGADAVVMVEDTRAEGDAVSIFRSVPPGANVTFAGTDIACGETVLRRGETLSARETGVLAAIGCDRVKVFSQPRVAILSTGDEIIAPGAPMRPGSVYDANATVIADTVRELGGEPVMLGIVPDDAGRLRAALQNALAYDVVVLSGGTSKGEGDISYRVVGELGEPGIVVHGVALKPGKPLCLAVVDETPIAVLPGFPTSAIFTFREFLGPVVRAMAGLPQEDPKTIEARLPIRITSARGRTEYSLVSLVTSKDGYAAYPLGKGSGSITTFSHADGYVTIPRNREYLDAGEIAEVRLVAPDVRLADLIVIGSHCLGVDWLLGRLRAVGFSGKFITVGSTGGVRAIGRGECDLAGIHLLDPKTGLYNESFVPENAVLRKGYRRRQGIVFRKGDPRFEGKSVEAAMTRALDESACRMVNRNRGSGTRILLDGLLDGARPDGYEVEARSHHAVAAAVAQRRADWGMAIEVVAEQSSLGFLHYGDEHYDFLVPKDRIDRPAVQAFFELLADESVVEHLARLGMTKDA